MVMKVKLSTPTRIERFKVALERAKKKQALASGYYLCEGIDVDSNKVVTINQSHNKGLDTSVERNPTVFNLYAGTGDNRVKFTVYSLFRRLGNNKKVDGNPLVKALKHEDGFTISPEAENFMWELCRDIAKKVAAELDGKIVVLTPSTSELNSMIWEHISDIFPNSKKISESPLDKISSEDMLDALSEDEFFINAWGRIYDDSEEANREFYNHFKTMGPYFKLHSLPLPLRGLVNRTMKVSKDFKHNFGSGGEIIGNDLLVIDDTVTKGQTLKEAYNLLSENFSPKSVTCLTLCSKLYTP
ncbi:MAG: hypothetical protein HUK21_10105 [Fibrobacteraceae bacterium]|nr:hypothetical protein [Fibrobacteraceae bacterium]